MTVPLPIVRENLDHGLQRRSCLLDDKYRGYVFIHCYMYAGHTVTFTRVDT